MKKCILCGYGDFIKLFETDGRVIARCKNCNLVRTLNFVVPKYNDYHRDEDYRKFEKHFRNIFQKRFNIIKRFKREPGKVLDIGTSTGIMLLIFVENGWEAWGVEPSKSAERLKDKNIKVLPTIIERADLPKSFFDVVILNHSLEHMEDPFGVLKKVKSVLKKGGIVYVDVPNFGSLSAQISRQYWKYLLPNEHLHHFTPKTLGKILEKSGYKIIYSRTRSGVFDESNILLYFYNALAERRIGVLFEILDIPGNIIATALNMGTGLSMIGRK